MTLRDKEGKLAETENLEGYIMTDRKKSDNYNQEKDNWYQKNDKICKHMLIKQHHTRSCPILPPIGLRLFKRSLIDTYMWIL